MVFDSVAFLVFFAIFFVVYHLLSRKLSLQNAWALVGSCVFYGWWDVRFLGLLLVAAGLDYLAGLGLERFDTPRSRRAILAASMSANLGILFVFKYFDFFSDSFGLLAQDLGWRVSLPLLRVALPVGISFYTFQSMSYTIDIYRRQARAERNPITYFTFVAFFPHMVAGPIQRASHLLSQLNRPRVLTSQDALEGVWLLTCGYFLKEAIADPLATLVNVAFAPDQRFGWMAVLGTLAFGLQIYCDFNGYSLIARGVGKLLGIEFIWNFNLPYFATSVRDFWRRWHISLSTWLRDYLYVPLGGSRHGRARTYANLLVTMTLGGLWHGASWNFVAWGVLHGAALAIERFWVENKPSWLVLPNSVGWVLTMLVVFGGWFLFRCSEPRLLQGMLASFNNMAWPPQGTRFLGTIAIFATPLLALELWQWRMGDLLAPLRATRLRHAVVGGVMLSMVAVMFGRYDYEFIYFQF